MTDIVDAATRSRMMRGIRGSNTRPELDLRKALHASGLRFRLHAKNLPGRPDIVLPRFRTAIFVHGCFWHRHDGCRLSTTPATRPEFWASKFTANVERDARNLDALSTLGWRVEAIWECELKGEGAVNVARRLQTELLEGWGQDAWTCANAIPARQKRAARGGTVSSRSHLSY